MGTSVAVMSVLSLMSDLPDNAEPYCNHPIRPEIDLAGPPTDPGISHLHAVLIAQEDGTWSVLDGGSSNGTQVNGREIEKGQPMPLHDGDRVCVGAWTALTFHSS